MASVSTRKKVSKIRGKNIYLVFIIMICLLALGGICSDIALAKIVGPYTIGQPYAAATNDRENCELIGGTTGIGLEACGDVQYCVVSSSSTKWCRSTDLPSVGCYLWGSYTWITDSAHYSTGDPALYVPSGSAGCCLKKVAQIWHEAAYNSSGAAQICNLTEECYDTDLVPGCYKKIGEVCENNSQCMKGTRGQSCVGGKCVNYKLGDVSCDSTAGEPCPSTDCRCGTNCSCNTASCPCTLAECTAQAVCDPCNLCNSQTQTCADYGDGKKCYLNLGQFCTAHNQCVKGLKNQSCSDSKCANYKLNDGECGTDEPCGANDCLGDKWPERCTKNCTEHSDCPTDKPYCGKRSWQCYTYEDYRQVECEFQGCDAEKAICDIYDIELSCYLKIGQPCISDTDCQKGSNDQQTCTTFFCGTPDDWKSVLTDCNPPEKVIAAYPSTSGPLCYSGIGYSCNVSADCVYGQNGQQNCVAKVCSNFLGDDGICDYGAGESCGTPDCQGYWRCETQAAIGTNPEGMTCDDDGDCAANLYCAYDPITEKTDGTSRVCRPINYKFCAQFVPDEDLKSAIFTAQSWQFDVYDRNKNIVGTASGTTDMGTFDISTVSTKMQNPGMYTVVWKYFTYNKNTLEGVCMFTIYGGTHPEGSTCTSDSECNIGLYCARDWAFSRQNPGKGSSVCRSRGFTNCYLNTDSTLSQLVSVYFPSIGKRLDVVRYQLWSGWHIALDSPKAGSATIASGSYDTYVLPRDLVSSVSVDKIYDVARTDQFKCKEGMMTVGLSFYTGDYDTFDGICSYGFDVINFDDSQSSCENCGGSWDGTASSRADLPDMNTNAYGTCCGDDTLDDPDWTKNMCESCKIGDNKDTRTWDDGPTKCCGDDGDFNKTYKDCGQITTKDGSQYFCAQRYLAWDWYNASRQNEGKIVDPQCNGYPAVAIDNEWRQCGNPMGYSNYPGTTMGENGEAYLCYNEGTQDSDNQIAECAGCDISLSAPDCTEPNWKSTSELGGRRLETGDKVYSNIGIYYKGYFYCTEEAIWEPNLERHPVACSLTEHYYAGKTPEHTGTQCCGYRADRLFYNDRAAYEIDVEYTDAQLSTFSRGACFDGQHQTSGSYLTVDGKSYDEVIIYKGSFMGCAIDRDQKVSDYMSVLSPKNDSISMLEQERLSDMGNDWLLSYEDNVSKGILLQDKGFCAYLDYSENPDDNSTDYFCSYSGKWMPTDVTRPFMRTIGWNNPSLQQSECCEKETQCWDGFECVESIHEKPTSPSREDGYRCVNGKWSYSPKKWSWDNQFDGWCPRGSQCLVEISSKGKYSLNDMPEKYGSTDGNPQCIESGQYILDHYCQNGAWTSRTKVIAETLLSFAADKGDFTLLCDRYANVFNEYIYSLPFKGNVENYLQSAPDQRTCGAVPCVNDFCVLRYESVQNGITKDVVIIGTSLNKRIGDFTDTDWNILEVFGFENSTQKKLCAPGSVTANGFRACDEEKKVFYSDKTDSMVFSLNGLGISSIGMPAALDFASTAVKDLIASIMYNKMTITQGLGAIEGERNFFNITSDFKKLYISKSSAGDYDRTIFGTVEEDKWHRSSGEGDTPIKHDILIAKYFNFQSDICDAFKNYTEQDLHKSGGQIKLSDYMNCRKIGNSYRVMDHNYDDSSLDHNAIWRKITSQLRPHAISESSIPTCVPDGCNGNIPPYCDSDQSPDPDRSCPTGCCSHYCIDTHPECGPTKTCEAQNGVHCPKPNICSGKNVNATNSERCCIEGQCNPGIASCAVVYGNCPDYSVTMAKLTKRMNGKLSAPGTAASYSVCCMGLGLGTSQSGIYPRVLFESSSTGSTFINDGAATSTQDKMYLSSSYNTASCYLTESDCPPDRVCLIGLNRVSGNNFLNASTCDAGDKKVCCKIPVSGCKGYPAREYRYDVVACSGQGSCDIGWHKCGEGATEDADKIALATRLGYSSTDTLCCADEGVMDAYLCTATCESTGKNCGTTNDFCGIMTTCPAGGNGQCDSGTCYSGICCSERCEDHPDKCGEFPICNGAELCNAECNDTNAFCIAGQCRSMCNATNLVSMDTSSVQESSLGIIFDSWQPKNTAPGVTIDSDKTRCVIQDAYKVGADYFALPGEPVSCALQYSEGGNNMYLKYACSLSEGWVGKCDLADLTSGQSYPITHASYDSVDLAANLIKMSSDGDLVKESNVTCTYPPGVCIESADSYCPSCIGKCIADTTGCKKHYDNCMQWGPDEQYKPCLSWQNSFSALDARCKSCLETDCAASCTSDLKDSSAKKCLECTDGFKGEAEQSIICPEGTVIECTSKWNELYDIEKKFKCKSDSTWSWDMIACGEPCDEYAPPGPQTICGTDMYCVGGWPCLSEDIPLPVSPQCYESVGAERYTPANLCTIPGEPQCALTERSKPGKECNSGTRTTCSCGVEGSIFSLQQECSNGNWVNLCDISDLPNVEIPASAERYTFAYWNPDVSSCSPEPEDRFMCHFVTITDDIATQLYVSYIGIPVISDNILELGAMDAFAFPQVPAKITSNNNRLTDLKQYFGIVADYAKKGTFSRVTCEGGICKGNTFAVCSMSCLKADGNTYADTAIYYCKPPESKWQPINMIPTTGMYSRDRNRDNMVTAPTMLPNPFPETVPTPIVYNSENITRIEANEYWSDVVIGLKIYDVKSPATS